jgi:phenylacetate-CoA ligase
MNYLFGEMINAILSVEKLEALLKVAQAKRPQLAKTPITEILKIFDECGKLWARGGKYYQKAFAALPGELSFSEEMIIYSLDMIPTLLSQTSLEERLINDFGSLTILDEFVEKLPFRGRLRFVPHGVLLHVAAGNVFLGAIDSLVIGLLTKNISIMKMSSGNQIFPTLFAQSLLEADKNKIITGSFALLHWKGGDKEIEAIFKKSVDAIVAWGGEDMVNAYREGLSSGIPLIEHGPKISFQIVTKRGLEKNPLKYVGQKVAEDIIAWDQAACASPQNLFLEEGVNVKELLPHIEEALNSTQLKRGLLDQDEAVEMLKEEDRARLNTLEGGSWLKGQGWLLHHDPRPGIRPSPLNRTLIIKSFKSLEDLLSQLKPAQRVLQSCGYLTHEDEKGPYLNRLAEFGVLRFARIGTVMEAMIGAPHDGRLSLMELGRLVPDEGRDDVLEFIGRVVKNNSFYNKIYAGKPPRKFSELIPVEVFNMPLPENPSGGYVFSSGGTSGNPKFVFFKKAEFEKVGLMLARGYKAQGIKVGTACANLFVAGNLWSSFLAVEAALSALGALQLPIGGKAESGLILDYLQRFKVEAVFGLPSLLVDLAAKSINEKRNVTVNKIFYAGEHLSLQGREILKTAWKTKEFYSAGYASVDAGPIGYQCAFNKSREHHLFEKEVHLEIINGEGVVTSLIRKAMPVIHLKTGDHLEWVVGDDCACGSREARFILHGRIDGQMRIWSSGILLEEIEKGFQDAKVQASSYQVTLSEEKNEYGEIIECMKIEFESPNRVGFEELKNLKGALYKNFKDLSATHDIDFLQKRLTLAVVLQGALPRVQRTGKIRRVVDLRKI